jgi:hypothetical protein
MYMVSPILFLSSVFLSARNVEAVLYSLVRCHFIPA